MCTENGEFENGRIALAILINIVRKLNAEPKEKGQCYRDTVAEFLQRPEDTLHASDELKCFLLKAQDNIWYGASDVPELHAEAWQLLVASERSYSDANQQGISNDILSIKDLAEEALKDQDKAALFVEALLVAIVRQVVAIQWFD